MKTSTIPQNQLLIDAMTKLSEAMTLIQSYQDQQATASAPTTSQLTDIQDPMLQTFLSLAAPGREELIYRNYRKLITPHLKINENEGNPVIRIVLIKGEYQDSYSIRDFCHTLRDEIFPYLKPDNTITRKYVYDRIAPFIANICTYGYFKNHA